MSDKLDRAIAQFEDENSTLTFSERFSNLRQAFMWNAFNAIKTIKKYGVKSPRSADEDYIQVEGMKQFGILEKMYCAELRANKLEGKNAEDLDKSWLKKIRESDSTIGQIVQSLGTLNGVGTTTTTEMNGNPHYGNGK